MMKNIPYFLIIFLLSGCGQKPERGSLAIKNDSLVQTQPVANESDSLNIIGLLKNVYQWNAKNQAKKVDFDIEVEDSLEMRINQKSFANALNALQVSGFFTDSFIANYKTLGELIDKKLTTAVPKYKNEINFTFQDADPWTFFQDDQPKFWEMLKILDFKLNGNACSLKWRVDIEGPSAPGYEVRFTKQNSAWKISYMEGFDIDKYYK